MRRAHVLVEGPTEEVFVKTVLSPYLEAQEGGAVHLTPVLLTTARTKQGKKFRGGVSSYARIVRDLKPLLGDSSVAGVTTMLDMYGLPLDFPGHAEMPRQGSPYDRVRHLEESFSRNVKHPRFLPYLSLHEFEALVLVEPELIMARHPRARSLRKLEQALASVTSPEEINDGPKTHPAARLRQAIPGYRKTSAGPRITQQAGMAALRAKCPHFDQWVSRLIKLGLA